jgi:hypothetical protein
MSLYAVRDPSDRIEAGMVYLNEAGGSVAELAFRRDQALRLRS